MGEVTWDMIITKVVPIIGFIGVIIALVVNTYFTNKGKKAGVRPHAHQLKKSEQKKSFWSRLFGK
ncbi:MULTISPECIES: hypothetical protein [Bacillus]|uniref:hypothetical protein n=1 Tax=Bacillus TaxID=1386 RepID=UPI0020C90DF6|nr:MULTISPECIES: hypothetical protein [Bacillus]MED1511898.1 hypothetical protein [Bacillus proteolyticus]